MTSAGESRRESVMTSAGESRRESVMTSAPVLLCVATGVEARACREGVRLAGTNARFEVLRTGMGPVFARRGLKRRLAERELPRPAVVVSTGFAGCWSPGIALGSWAVGRSVSSEGGERWELGNGPGAVTLSGSAFERCMPAHFVSLSRPKSGAVRDRPAGLPVLVDMESFAWAEVARFFGVPYLILRLVSDTPEAPLHGAVESLASLASAESAAERATLSVRGVTQALSRPIELGKFLWRSAPLPSRLAEGWAALARDFR